MRTHPSDSRAIPAVSRDVSISIDAVAEPLLETLRGRWASITATMARAARAAAPGLTDPQAFAEQLAGALARSLATGAPVAVSLPRACALEGPEAGLTDAAVEAALSAGHAELASGADPVQVRRLTQSLLRVHAAARFGANRSSASIAGQDNRTDEFVDHALRSAPSDERALMDAANRLGLNSTSWGLVLLVAENGGTHGLYDAAAALPASGSDCLAGPVHHDPVPHVPVLVGVADGADWPAASRAVRAALDDHGAGLLHTATGAATGLGQIGAAYEAARRNLMFALLVPPRGAAIDPSALQLGRLLASVPAGERLQFFRGVLGEVVSSKRAAAMLDALDALVWAADRAEAMRALGIGERSLTRALSDVRRLTQRDWNHQFDRLLLSVAVLCRRLAALYPEYDERAWGRAPRPLHPRRAAE